MKVREQDGSDVNFVTRIYVPSLKLGITFQQQKASYSENIEEGQFFYGDTDIREYEAEGSLLEKIETHVDIKQLGNGEFIRSIEHDFEHNVEHVQTRVEWFTENLLNQQTPDGNLIEEYDAENHSVLIRCQKELCNCVGSWWEPAQLHFPSTQLAQRPAVRRASSRVGIGRRP